MFIQTYEQSYQVISHVLNNDMGEIYICRDISTDLEYTLLRIKDKDIVPELMVYLNMTVKKSFTDYRARFVFEGDLCLVFSYYRGLSLSDKLTNEYSSLKERMTIGQRILDRMVLLDMPLYFLKNCLTKERIVVKPSLEVSFNYVPGDIRYFAAANDRGVLTGFASVFNMLFADELTRESVPPINRFYSALQKEYNLDNIQLYKDYLEMCREVELIPEEDIKKPKSKWFLLWEKVKNSFKAVKKILAAVLFVVAVIYLAYTAGNYINPKTTQVMNFDFIGTLKIDQVQ